ncbi:hypothetical protein RI367_000670 [Sorochytrium milnesiophthora]
MSPLPSALHGPRAHNATTSLAALLANAQLVPRGGVQEISSIAVSCLSLALCCTCLLVSIERWRITRCRINALLIAIWALYNIDGAALVLYTSTYTQCPRPYFSFTPALNSCVAPVFLLVVIHAQNLAAALFVIVTLQRFKVVFMASSRYQDILTRFATFVIGSLCVTRIVLEIVVHFVTSTSVSRAVFFTSISSFVVYGTFDMTMLLIVVRYVYRVHSDLKQSFSSSFGSTPVDGENQRKVVKMLMYLFTSMSMLVLFLLTTWLLSDSFSLMLMNAVRTSFLKIYSAAVMLAIAGIKDVMQCRDKYLRFAPHPSATVLGSSKIAAQTPVLDHCGASEAHGASNICSTIYASRSCNPRQVVLVCSNTINNVSDTKESNPPIKCAITRDIAQWEQFLVDQNKRSQLPRASYHLRRLQPLGVSFIVDNLRLHEEMTLKKLERYPEILNNVHDFGFVLSKLMEQAEMLLAQYVGGGETASAPKELAFTQLLSAIQQRVQQTQKEATEQPTEQLLSLQKLLQGLFRFFEGLRLFLEQVTAGQYRYSEFVADFEKLEEENLVCRDVLAQLSVNMSDVSVITIKRFVDTPKPKQQVRDVGVLAPEQAADLGDWTPMSAKQQCLPGFIGIEQPGKALASSVGPSKWPLCEECTACLKTGKQAALDAKLALSAAAAGSGDGESAATAAAAAAAEKATPAPEEEEKKKAPSKTARRTVRSALGSQVQSASPAAIKTSSVAVGPDSLPPKCENKAVQVSDEKALSASSRDAKSDNESTLEAEEVLAHPTYKKLEQALAKANVETDVLRKQTKMLSTQVDDHKAHIAQLLDNQASLHGLLAATQANLAALSTQHGTLRSSHNTLLKDIGQTQEDLSSTQESLKEQRVKIEYLEGLLDDRDQEIRTLRLQNDDAIKQMNDTSFQAAQDRASLQQILNTSQSREQATQDLHRQINQLHGTIHILMKFPDVSLDPGLFRMPERVEANDTRVQGIIAANNERIHLLERKNEELRQWRIHRASDVTNLVPPTLTPTNQAMLYQQQQQQQQQADVERPQPDNRPIEAGSGIIRSRPGSGRPQSRESAAASNASYHTHSDSSSCLHQHKQTILTRFPPSTTTSLSSAQSDSRPTSAGSGRKVVSWETSQR